MPRIYLCFLWHMHQPFYKDLVSGEYKLPWTRLHALKDYYGMVHMLKEFPEVRQTFNLVPSLMVQVEDYAAGRAADPFLRAALKPAETLTTAEREFILTYFFQASNRLINRFPRFAELYEAWRAADCRFERASHLFSTTAFRDLQVLSQLAWFDEEFLSGDPETRRLVEKGREYTLEDQELAGRKEIEILNKVLPAYARLAAKGQIEISTTPFYHPILPLLCDSNIASVSHPHVPLPSRFRYPQDARDQLERARSYVESRFGARPAGLWPSEGSVSDEVLQIAAEIGYEWIATDNGVLARTLGHSTSVEENYRPYIWRQGNRSIKVIFRDHFLSDLIGFVYSRMDATEAAKDFLGRIRENCRGILGSGHDALVPIILDGENAWEYYHENGRPFLRELYRRITNDPVFSAVTVREGFERVPAQPLEHIFPGSWISANFDVWIGAEEDNKAWEYLLRARQTYEAAEREGHLPREALELAYEELLIAEGSDWCWWYGPEHQSANRPEFDQLFRDHLANVYRALRQNPPEELSRPILKVAVAEFHSPQTGRIRPILDGEVSSYFEWLGGGIYRVDARSGAMHGKRYLIRELHYGSDGENVYVRIDFENIKELPGMEAQVRVQSMQFPHLVSIFRFAIGDGRAEILEQLPAASNGTEGIGLAFRKLFELRLPLKLLGVDTGQSLMLQVSLWHGGLPMDAIPHQGWLQIPTSDPAD